ncbi:MAG: DUF6169 family protein [Paludibacteraceae bacterium]|nr:DUF6169 family protein [Paludibacteraceae bacterium]
MISENFESSNITAPLKIFKEKDRDVFYFKVNTSEYRVAFVESTPLGTLQLDSIIIARDTKDNGGNDKFEQTIIAILVSLLDKDRVLCFTCDTEDGEQFARQRLFKTWFKKNQIAIDYEMVTIDDEGDLCGGILIKKSNPLYSVYLEDLKEFKKEMEECKPNFQISNII